MIILLLKQRAFQVLCYKSGSSFFRTLATFKKLNHSHIKKGQDNKGQDN